MRILDARCAALWMDVQGGVVPTTLFSPWPVECGGGELFWCSLSSFIIAKANINGAVCQRTPNLIFNDKTLVIPNMRIGI
jgi:hypothetical protein